MSNFWWWFDYRFRHKFFQFRYLSLMKWGSVLQDMPFEARLAARWIEVRVRRHGYIAGGLLFGQFMGCVRNCTTGHAHRRPIIYLYEQPILMTTAHEKVPEAIRGILIHEACHWLGLSDECAYKVGATKRWYWEALNHLKYGDGEAAHAPH